ncbi:MAG: ferric uptake regulation protein [Candidatus Muiribacterium halophilum]|uniref:Ferric uptake regulation protein n=1 Tax=Muiribacterium halophilum TaxID=2053465 RepID=A0A2N5ZA25_MUIH1|nr:MAG: ferric uptake regulation protein [Candidatus Muirbacterium halophilum]
MRNRKQNCRCCDDDKEKCSFRETFSEKGLRFTVPRQLIIKVLNDSKDSLSGEDIYNLVHKNNPNIGIATVYRTLDLLYRMGMLSGIKGPDKVTRYEIAGKNAHRHELVCVSCRKVIEYTPSIEDKQREATKEMQIRLENKYEFNINNHLVRFFGICKECSE